MKKYGVYLIFTYLHHETYNDILNDNLQLLSSYTLDESSRATHNGDSVDWRIGGSIPPPGCIGIVKKIHPAMIGQKNHQTQIVHSFSSCFKLLKTSGKPFCKDMIVF